MKLLTESIGSVISDISLSNTFLWYISSGKGNKRKINKWDYIKPNIFCTAKETISKVKRQPTEWGEIFTNNTPDKGLISKICKKLTKLNTEKPKNSIKYLFLSKCHVWDYDDFFIDQQMAWFSAKLQHQNTSFKLYCNEIPFFGAANANKLGHYEPKF